MGERKRRASLTGGDWTSRRLEQGACLHCGAALNAVTGPAERPAKGSIMVCGECGYIMEWDGERHVELSEAAMTELSADPHYEDMLAITRRLRDLPRIPDRIVMLEAREPEICEDCGDLSELRPYGHKKSDGKRRWVCFRCAMRDTAETDRAIEERFEGRNPV
jgi:hypothetical protein